MNLHPPYIPTTTTPQFTHQPTMAKITLLLLALAALVALATAHTTIITTTIDDENPISEQRQCRQQVQGQRLNQCRMFLQQGQRGQQHQQQQHQQQEQQLLQQCCQELQNIEGQCQCEAVKQVVRDAQRQQQQRPRMPFQGSQQSQQLKQRAQILPNVCNLQSRRCEIESVRSVAESNFEIPFDMPFDIPWPFRPSSESQQCRQSEIQRPVSQCQRYVEQQIQSSRPYQQSPYDRRQQSPYDRRQQSPYEQRQGPYEQRPYEQRPYQQRGGRQQEQQGLQQCCNELQNVRRECQCEAIKEVGQRMRQQQQQQRRQYGGQQTQTVERILENLPNQCDLDVQQCNIPY
ncbi:putative bifunctional inhibitor/plant lipid transfer protein/seed storage helical [Helianthus annuus]|uniref:Bifunctional inhibitor/plant lipid transfer protein/seed storage helical n=2 Tax=Helianthus annuus TaxID=4232 RepID=A0A9K3MZM2_HELAN|nr:putative bifunctional inhibitor/plant lipid transfer protein/seed storage helical [Helianthus annuus]KAJ0500768.1 putative bifunctional inhibitor/plant lipid transfer protein/seed storage helical [Helianthus annuus]KAJ0869765.1 putative bifunctional inhibitor/plant lipid transfer protein/seed storage helical [Helianthus annuus]